MTKTLTCPEGCTPLRLDAQGRCSYCGAHLLDIGRAQCPVCGGTVASGHVADCPEGGVWVRKSIGKMPMTLERAEELLESTGVQLKRTQDWRERLERENKRMRQAFSDLAFQELASSITDVRVRKALEQFVKVMGRDDNAEG